jgi:hypothetical protein
MLILAIGHYAIKFPSYHAVVQDGAVPDGQAIFYHYIDAARKRFIGKPCHMRGYRYIIEGQ